MLPPRNVQKASKNDKNSDDVIIGTMVSDPHANIRTDTIITLMMDASLQMPTPSILITPINGVNVELTNDGAKDRNTDLE